MNVCVGAFSDPEGLEGLAHFLGMISLLQNRFIFYVASLSLLFCLVFILNFELKE